MHLKIQKLISKAFSTPQISTNKYSWILDYSCNRNDGAKIFIVLPTIQPRTNSGQINILLEQIARSALQVKDVLPSSDLTFCLMLQSGTDGAINNEPQLALRLRKLLKHFVDFDHRTINNINVIGAYSCDIGKTNSLNAALVEAKRLNSEGILLLDDDITLKSACIENLIFSFLNENEPIAIGATKIGSPDIKYQSSKFLAKVKEYTQPATSYPHACCMIVSASILSQGFPARYTSDDGYICFELINPSDENPLRQLQLIENAVCYHIVGGDFKSTYTRIKRMLRHHYIFIADYPWEKSKFYIKELLLFGLWPISSFDSSKGVAFGLKKWLLKLLYLTIFLGIGAGLIFRAIAGCPLKNISWGGDLDG